MDRISQQISVHVIFIAVMTLITYIINGEVFLNRELILRGFSFTLCTTLLNFKENSPGLRVDCDG